MKWYAIGDNRQGGAVSFASDDSEGFDLDALVTKFGVVVEIPHQPANGEIYDVVLREVVVLPVSTDETVRQQLSAKDPNLWSSVEKQTIAGLLNKARF